MEEMIPCSIKDQEVFRRVWQRVMAGRDDAQCPLDTLPPNLQGDLSCECLEALVHRQGTDIPEECERQGGEETPAVDGSAQEQPGPTTDEKPVSEPVEQDQSVPEPSQSAAAEVSEGLPEADGSSRGGDMPHLWEEPQETTDRTARLRSQVMEALEGWQFYRHLARRARAGDARVLNSMAGEMHRNARKLSAAYFLLTGLRYWPSELLSTPAIPSYWGALRARHQAEQRQETAYRIAADDWDDSDMRELYAELIEAAQRRSRQLRGLLEQDVS